MRTWFVTIFLAFLVCASEAQNISRQYDGISISQALTDIAKASADYKINFIYNELDEFPVICHFQNLSIVEAIMRVVGQYPVKISIRDRHIFVECAEKMGVILAIEPVYKHIVYSPERARKVLDSINSHLFWCQ